MMVLDPRREGTSPTLRGVQALRGLAASMVVVHHAITEWATHVSNGRTPRLWPNGAAGVDIFFVISGVVMAVSTIGREDAAHPARRFLERRLIRIVPMYWIMTFAMLLEKEMSRWHHQYGLGSPVVQITFPYVVSSLFFIPFRNSLGEVLPLLGPGWTLSYEMFFYLLFALALAMRVGVVRMLTPVMIMLTIIGVFHQANWPTASVLLDPLLLEFLAGVLLGHFALKVFRMNLVLSVGMGFASLGILLFVPLGDFPGARLVQWGAPAVLLVQSVLAIEYRYGESWPRWSLLLGDASYSLYLGHVLVFVLLTNLLVKWHFITRGVFRWESEVATVFVLFFGSIFASLLTYRLLEKPMNDRLRRLILDNRKPQLGRH